MTSGVIADSIVNLCGAIGVAVAMMTFYRRDPRSPLTRRLLLALGVIATLFLDRGLAWWSGSFVLDRLSVIPAALIPLGALIVTEGILRRHAPRS
jgi:ABC-type transport system involved in cytochrome c biogenesis permease subunit